MVIHIGIIGTKEVIEQIRQVIKMFPTFVPQFHVVEQERDIPDIAQIISSEVEVILLSGQVTSRKVKEKLTLPIPVHFVPITEAGLYKAILSAVLLNNLEHGISVDSLTKVTVSRAMKELGFSDIPYTVYNGPAYSSTDRIVSFHKEQFEEGRCSIIFTGIQAVRDQLAELNIPNVLFSPSDQDIIVALERALLSTESRRNKEAQVVVGIINVDDFSKLVLSKPNEHEVQRLKLDIHRMLLKYVETLDGHLTALSGDEYLFFTTRGIFERETGGYKTIPLAKDMKQNLNLSLSLGIGLGSTAHEAGTNARDALRQAKSAGGNSCFLIREDKSMIGPLEMSDPIQSTLAPLDSDLVLRAKEAGMTTNYLSKLVAYMTKHQRYEYHVHELASMLNITVRSAHRLLLSWMDSGLIEISRYEKVPKGRPRQLYRFTFLEKKAH